MRWRGPTTTSLALFATLTVASSAHGEEPAERDLVRFTTRPAVLPRGALTTGVEVAWRWYGESYTALAQRVELSVLDDLSLRVVPAAALLSEPASFGAFEAGASVRLARGVFEPTLGLDLGATGGGSMTLLPSAALSIHANETFRFDVAVHPTFVVKGKVAAHLDRLDAALASRGFLALDFWLSLRRELSVAIWTCFGADNPYAMEGTGFTGLGMTWLGTIPLGDRPLLDLRLDAGHPAFHRFVTAVPQFKAFQLLGTVSVHGDLF